jgi:hypothetical protein
MSWITLVTVLVAWSLVGLGVAYLFGRFIHGVEVSGSAGDRPLPGVSYLRHVKRPRTSSRATAHAKARREASAGRRPH